MTWQYHLIFGLASNIVPCTVLYTICASGFAPGSPLWQKYRLMISGDGKACWLIHAILLHCWKDLCTGRVSYGAFRWFGLNMQVPSHDFEQVERRNSLHLNLGFAELSKPSLASNFTFWYLLMLGDLQWSRIHIRYSKLPLGTQPTS